MPVQRLVLAVVACAVCFGAGGLASGAEPTTVALTMTKPATAGKDPQLAENLLTLVELAVQADKSLAVVERRQIELVIQELVLSQTRPENSQLELGKLITADFLVMLELLPPDKESGTALGARSGGGTKTAAVHGVAAAKLDAATLEETAGQFAAFISAVIRARQAGDHCGRTAV